MNIQDIVKETGEFFNKSFGETPISQRLRDIYGEALELSRYTTLANVKEETGDLLASLFALCYEAGFDPEELLKENRQKINKRQDQYKTLGRKIRVAVLGGAFDPIHSGHIALSKFVLDSSKYFDQVWLMPCYDHMYGKQMSSAADRFDMCEIAAKQDLRIKVSDFEIKNKLCGETFQTVKLLLSEDDSKHKYEFAFIIGMDNANSAPKKWVNFSELEKMLPFVVVPRKGEIRDVQERWYLSPPHIFLEPDDPNIIPEISSTEIRQMIHCVKPSETILDTNVLKYILRHKLYNLGQ